MTHSGAVALTTLWRHTDAAITGVKGSTCYGNADSISHTIISRCGMAISMHINRTLTKLCNRFP